MLRGLVDVVELARAELADLEPAGSRFDFASAYAALDYLDNLVRWAKGGTDARTDGSGEGEGRPRAER